MVVVVVTGEVATPPFPNGLALHISMNICIHIIIKLPKKGHMQNFPFQNKRSTKERGCNCGKGGLT